MQNVPKPGTWNEVKALFESLKNDIGGVADGVADAHRDIKIIRTKLDAVVNDVAVMKPALQKAVNDIETIKNDLKDMRGRLITAEAKLPA